MSISHTPEPWEAFTDCPGECCWMIRMVENDEGHSELICSPETDEVNARRIVACVNACAGIPNGNLESGGVFETVKAQRDELLGALKDAAIGNRDIQLQAAETWMNKLNAEIERKDVAIAELLAALKAIVDLDDGDKPDLWHFEAEFDAGRAAIAKVEPS